MSELRRWPKRPLGEVATLQRGFDLPAQVRIPGDYPVFAANGPHGSHSVAKCRGPGVVTGRSGTIGKVHFIEGDYWPLNTSLYVRDFHGNDPKWVFYLLAAFRLERFSEGAGVPTLNRNLVHGELVQCPPLAEQRRIAAMLDKADAIRRKRREALMLTDEFLRSAFLDLFGDPVTNPKGWNKARLEELTTKIGSGSTPLGGESVYQNEGLSFIRSMNVYDGRFLYDDLAHIDEVQAKRLTNVEVSRNDLLINITGASVARTCLVPNDVLPARVNQHVTIVRCGSDLVPEFLEAQMISVSVKALLLRIGASMGATRQAITKSQLEDFKVIAPPKVEQERFKEIASVVRRQHQKEELMYADTETLFGSLQQRAFNGELAAT